jgi:CBS domain-containing protein
MTTTAADIMTSPVITVSPDTSMGEIVAVLAQKHISAVPVCRPDGTLAGIVTEGDVLKPIRESVRARRDWWLGLLSEGEELPQAYLEYLRSDTRKANDVMVHDVITADRTATLGQIAELMIAHSIKRIPILSNDRVVGIVSRADMVAALALTPALFE